MEMFSRQSFDTLFFLEASKNPVNLNIPSVCTKTNVTLSLNVRRKSLNVNRLDEVLIVNVRVVTKGSPTTRFISYKASHLFWE